MATTTCGKCNNSSFEAKELIPKGSYYKLIVIQCSNCGTPISVMDGLNIGAKLEQVERDMKDHFSNIENNQQRIYAILQSKLK